MTTADQKLARARDLCVLHFGKMIVRSNINLNFERYTIELADGIRINIQYNNFDEYSYSVFFSAAKDDFCRFDDYDDKWKVTTKPHHLHPRWRKDVVGSNMVGDPEHDMPLFCAGIKDGLWL